MLREIDLELEKVLTKRKLFFNFEEENRKLSNIASRCEKSFLSHEEKAIPMFKSKIASSLHVDERAEKIIVDAGGTNFRIMLVEKRGGEFVVKDFQRYPMPGSDGEISKDVFFEKIAGFIIFYLLKNPEINDVGFCFSYPFETNEKREGFVSYLSKDIKIKGLKKSPLIKSIKSAILHNPDLPLDLKSKIPRLKFVLLNDTVATLISGKFFHKKNHLGFLGLVIGTGFNVALEKDEQIYNSEIGMYSHLTMNKVDFLVDTSSNSPGIGLAEKKISGKYFGKNFLFYLRELAQENFFSSELNAWLKKSESLDMAFVYERIFNDTEKFLLNEKRISSADLAKIRNLFYFLVFRSSFYAALLTNALIKCLKLTKGDLLISANGSMLEKCPFYLDWFKNNLNKLKDNEGLNYDFEIVKNSPTYGAFLAKYF